MCKAVEDWAEELLTEGEAKGRAEGEARGILKTLSELVKDGILTLSDAAKRANMTIEEFELEAASQS